MVTQHLCVVRGSLFRYVAKTTQYDELGDVGCTVVGIIEQEQTVFKLGCYNEQNEYVCTANIGPSNEAGANVALQGNYVSFKDEAGTTWSLQFESEEEAVAFCGSVAVAMYGAAGQPQDSILVCDVAKGIRGKTALADSLVKVRFSAWVVQSDPKNRIPVLGSLLDGTEQKLFTTTVPPNHLSVSADMKGFEGLLVGMQEQGCRFIVIPKAAQRGAGPKVNMCFFVEVLRVKLPDRASEGGAAANTSLIVGANASSSSSSPAHGGGGGQPQALQLATLPVSTAVRGPSAPAPGFDRDQFMMVDRLRDQVFMLTEQLREARQQLQTFGADVRSFEQQRKPKSLLNVQIEHSVHKLLTDVDEQKERLGQRDEALARMEEKNAQLQRTLEKFQQTSALLQEERKSKLTVQDEERLELDRQILQAQTHFGRLSAEVEDTVRNVNAVKRLLDQTGSDIKKEKNELQVALVSFQTGESKLATVKESLHEEMERCALLESKVGLLGTELQTLQGDIQAKDRAIEECQRKTESDVLHYEQLLETEQQKAAEELRGVRQELMTELGARERRYQEECQRVAQEAYDRGHIQGRDDGLAEALLAADMKARELTLAAQRNNAEAKAMESRIRVAKEEKTVDERRLSAEMEAAEEKLAEEQRQIAVLERDVEGLTQQRDLAVERTFDAVQRAIEASKGKPISQRMLLRILGAVQAGESDVDFSLQAREELEDHRREAQEKSEVETWVRAAVYNQPASMPPLRPCSAAAGGSAGEPLGKEKGTFDGNDNQFIKLDDILRIREARRKEVELPPAAAILAPSAQSAPPAQHAVTPPPAQPVPPLQPTQVLSQQQSLPSQPIFVARNPFQQQPARLPPPTPQPTQSTALVGPQTTPQAQQPPRQPSQEEQPTQAAAPPSTATAPQPPPQPVPGKARAAFPSPHVRPLADFAPPPSLNDS